MKIAYLLLLMVGSFASLGGVCDPVDWDPTTWSQRFVNSSWTLTAMGDGQSLRMVSNTPPVTLEFTDAHALERAELNGDTGCNAYSGAFEPGIENGGVAIPLGRVTVSGVGDSGGGMPVRMVDFEITERGCPTPDLFEREAMYQDTLTTARSAMRVGPRLIIESVTGGVLVLDRRQ